MLLTDVKTYLAAHGQASLGDLAMHFTMDPDAMKGILETWIAKGRCRRVSDRLPCGGCGKCESATTDIYEWVGTTSRPLARPCGS
jgi:hypothetical protein